MGDATTKKAESDAIDWRQHDDLCGLLTGFATECDCSEPMLDDDEPRSTAIQSGGAMTLSEFLLARIAEDERYDWRTCSECGTSEQRCLRANGAGFIKCCPDCRHPARVLAECEAKRSIVATLRACHSTRFPRETATDVNHFTPLAWGIFCDLALPYADHPDYREEWKP